MTGISTSTAPAIPSESSSPPDLYDHRRGGQAECGNPSEGQRPQRHVPDPRQRTGRRSAVHGRAPHTGGVGDPGRDTGRSAVDDLRPADRQRTGSVAGSQTAPQAARRIRWRRLGHPDRHRLRARRARHRDRLGSLRQHHVAAELHLRSGRQVRRHPRQRCSTPPKQLQSLGGLNGPLEQMRQRFGDTRATAS